MDLIWQIITLLTPYIIIAVWCGIVWWGVWVTRSIKRLQRQQDKADQHK